MSKTFTSRGVATTSNDDLLGATRITLGNSATLAALVAAGVGDNTLDGRLTRLAFVPVAGCVNNLRRDGTGAATTSYPAVPAGGFSFGSSADLAGAWRLVGSGEMDVFQFGPTA